MVPQIHPSSSSLAFFSLSFSLSPPAPRFLHKWFSSDISKFILNGAGLQKERTMEASQNEIILLFLKEQKDVYEMMA